MEDRLIEEKKANALKQDARARLEDDSDLVFGFGGMLRSVFGGLWVGGTASLYETRLVFRPNRLNRAAHADDEAVEIALDSVADVRVRSGFLTDIIDVATEEEGLTIRCYGADRFARRIRSQVDLLTGTSGSA